MRQAYSIALMLVVLGVAGRPLGATPGGPEVLEQARLLVANHEYQKAATVLEEGLPGSAAADRAGMVSLLRQTYQNLIMQADTAGKAREAAEYRDNLAILEPETATPSAQDASTGQARTARPSAAVSAVASPAPLPKPAETLAIPRSATSPEQLPGIEGTEPTTRTCLHAGSRWPCPASPGSSSGNPTTQQGRHASRCVSPGGGDNGGRRSASRKCKRSRRASRISASTSGDQESRPGRGSGRAT